MKERILRLCARGKIAINLRGMEYLQTQPGEDEDTAWKRLRPKLSYTGRQLDEVFLMEPSAVPTTGGTTRPHHRLVVGAMVAVCSAAEQPHCRPMRGDPPDPVASPRHLPVAGSSVAASPAAAASRASRLNNPPTSPLNLIGKLEGWGIGPATPVAEVSIKVSAATGAQLKELLKKLPDGMTFELSLEKEDD